MKIDFIRDSEADALLADETFLAQWRVLWEQCPWATAFQSPGFTATWYAVYGHEFRPLLILSRASDGTLQGLLTLALSTSSRKVIFAGRHQAEYHAWICTPLLANEFPPRAIEALHSEFPAATLRFHYLAAGIPLDWLSQSRTGRLCFLATHRRPLLKFGDGKDIHASLAKGSNKSKLKRLGKMGGVEFTRITDPDEFDAIFDDIVRLYDLRHGAVHGSGGFYTTSLQRPFHRAILAVPDLLHLTVMRVAGRLAAAHFGAIGRKELQLGIIVHDPTLSKHSPGKLHLLLLSQMLMREGFEQFDLTASGDAYKERSANDADEVHTLIVHPSATQKYKTLLRERTKSATKKLVKTALRRFDVNPLRAKLRMKTLMRPAYLGLLLLRSTMDRIAPRRETHLYRRPIEMRAGGNGIGPVRRDALEDLLAYEPSAREVSRQAFLADALERLEGGQHVYTRDADGRLLCATWLRTPEILNTRRCPGEALPPKGMLIEESYRPCNAEVNGAADECLNAILNDAANLAEVDSLLIQLKGNRPAERRRVEAMGFIHLTTFVEKRASRIVAAPTSFPAEQPAPATVKDPHIAVQKPDTSQHAIRRPVSAASTPRAHQVSDFD